MMAWAPHGRFKSVPDSPIRAAQTRMVGAISSGMHGIAAGLSRLDTAAARIARDGSGDHSAANAVDLMRARHEVRASLAVVRAADDVIGSILDVFA